MVIDICQTGNDSTKTQLNESIAIYLGWQREEDFHSDRENWEGWRNPAGEQGYVNVPDFLKILTHFVPAIESLIEND